MYRGIYGCAAIFACSGIRVAHSAGTSPTPREHDEYRFTMTEHAEFR
jgi:hypothetical protein